MRRTGPAPTDKSKGVASASDTFAQTLLGNMKFRPQTTSVEMMERISLQKIKWKSGSPTPRNCQINGAGSTGTQISASSFSSQDKMDKKGVHSPTNAIRSTVSDDKDTASSVQTIADEDTSNPFMAVTLPKSKEESSSSRRRLPRSFIPTLEKFFQQGQDKHIITTQKPDPSEDRLVPDTDRINTSSRRDSPTNNRTRSLSFGEENLENYGEHSYYQDPQNPNEDNDSGMSFDSIALHNLDT
ncbi:hypothetical protein H5410_033466 [Solanum commersonii]|uniref:Uncharacterized protein n=1 Tax=Solanum commersonii TaxID=4109 RepID=A0A9J5YQW3_SOLCO|nr:hypothetical protein H5410_033466 [Solanum commersonii]